MLCADNYESNHTFSNFANWLIPGTLLVGRYPYVEPSRCKTYEEGEQKLQQILDTGVTTFVSLQVRQWTCLKLTSLHAATCSMSACLVMCLPCFFTPPVLLCAWHQFSLSVLQGQHRWRLLTSVLLPYMCFAIANVLS